MNSWNVDPSHLCDIESLKMFKAIYGRVVDALVEMPHEADPTMIEQLFTEDAMIDFTASGLGIERGIAKVKTFFLEFLPSRRATVWHSFHSPIIRIDGNKASAQWTVHAFATNHGEPDAKPSLIYGRYLDEYVRSSQGWQQTSLIFTDARRVSL